MHYNYNYNYNYSMNLYSATDLRTSIKITIEYRLIGEIAVSLFSLLLKMSEQCHVLDFSPYCFFIDLLLVTFNIVRVGQFIEPCSSLL